MESRCWTNSRNQESEDSVDLDEGECFIVLRGVEHNPVADGEAHVLLFEPAETRNTGNVENERTADTETI